MLLAVTFVFTVPSKSDGWYTAQETHPPFYSRVVPAQPEEKKEYSKFFKEKKAILADIESTANTINQNYVAGNIQISRSLFKKVLDDKLKKNNNISYDIFFDPRFNEHGPNAIGIMVASVIVAYEDDLGKIVWRFDIVFEENLEPVIMNRSLNTKDDP